MNLTTGSSISFFTLRRAMMYEDYCDTLQFISCNFLALPGINFRNIFLHRLFLQIVATASNSAFIKATFIK